MSQASRYDLLQEYAASAGPPADPDVICDSPGWALAVIRLGRPQSFTRRGFKGIGKVTEGAFTRKEEPLLITDDCVALTIQSAKRAHTKTLDATLRNTDINYLSQDVLLPGDWVLAWCTNNQEDLVSVLERVRRGEPANGARDGLKFVGRVHTVRKTVQQDPASGRRMSSFQLQAVGFEELDTQFFYDFALATASAVSSQIRTFMAQLGLNFSELAEAEQVRAGNVHDNADRLIVGLINIILGRGADATVNQPIERAADAAGPVSDRGSAVDTSRLKLAPQANKEAPFAYLVPRAVGLLLGRDVTLASKEGVFGYADVMETLVGVQRYTPETTPDERAFVPGLDLARSTQSRLYTPLALKGTFLPVNPSFVNRPLWTMLQEFLNPAINEMYTALRINPEGRVVPTLVVRQIPFSTESIQERPEFPLTRFLGLPRWVLSPVMVQGFSVGRSNATRVNMVHVYGNASAYAANRSVTNQLVRNPPIFDEVDIQRSGIRARMMTVNCALNDQVKRDGARTWMEAIADWSFGSQYTLNGTVEVTGLQSAVAEGDNVELEGIVYHVEALVHRCFMAGDKKKFRTTLMLSNGMPADQGDATDDFPRYPGFKNVATTTTRTENASYVVTAAEATDDLPAGTEIGQETVIVDRAVAAGNDPEVLTELDPGTSFDSVLTRYRPHE